MSRTYRLAPIDRTGWLFGLGPAQVLPLAIGVIVAAVVVARTGSLLLAAPVMAAGLALAGVRVSGAPALEAAPVFARWSLGRGQHHFRAPIPAGGPHPVFPRPLAEMEFVSVDGDGGPIGVAVSPRQGWYAVSARVTSATPFLLADSGEQERLLGAFGDMLASLDKERMRLISLRWTSFVAPDRLFGLRPFELESIEEELERLGEAPRHEVLLTLTAAGRQGRADPGRARAVADELRLIDERLGQADLFATPLSPGDLTRALRDRLDPARKGVAGRARSLAEAVGLVTPALAGPLGALEHRDHWEVDVSVHRAYYVREWPRTDVPPSWLGDLLLALPHPRTVGLVFEPIAPQASRRAIARQAVKLSSDEEQRRRAGFRVGAQHDQSRTALAAREAELVAGYPEVDYAGLVVLSASTREELLRKETQALSAAASAGVELAPLDRRHAAGVCACLPLAYGLAPGGRR